MAVSHRNRPLGVSSSSQQPQTFPRADLVFSSRWGTGAVCIIVSHREVQPKPFGKFIRTEIFNVFHVS